VIEKQKELYESNKVLWKIGEEPRFWGESWCS
jgi:hypothetical protein